MEIIFEPKKTQWATLLKRPVMDTSTLENKVKEILDSVKHDGDAAVLNFTRTYDNASITNIEISRTEIESSIDKISPELKQAIQIAYQNITKFHASQAEPVQKIEIMPGVTCWRKSVGIERVGLYIPGGTAPLFSTILMLGIPAKLAGCSEVILCTPEKQGQTIHPAILYAASIVGINRVFKVGGAHAIAAMAHGTETIPRVSKIFGPGNQFVTMAKMLVAKEGVAIDMPAGPSEVMVVADHTAVPAFVASDLLSQCELGADSQAILVTTHKPLIDLVQTEILKQLDRLPRKELTAKSLEHSKLIYVSSETEMVELINIYAPEHLIVSVENFNDITKRIINAGSVFLGNYSPESAGDYASGTNHTLPTNGFARAYSGVSLDSFVRKITFQEITREGLTKLGPTIEELAAAEQLDAHKQAVTIRLNTLK